MQDKIGVGALKNIKVLYDGDIYDMACLLLKIHEAKDKGLNRQSRHTVYGLATAYAMIAGLSPDEIREIFKKHGLPFEATVEYDEDVG